MLYTKLDCKYIITLHIELVSYCVTSLIMSLVLAICRWESVLCKVTSGKFSRYKAIFFQACINNLPVLSGIDECELFCLISPLTIDGKYCLVNQNSVIIYQRLVFNNYVFITCIWYKWWRQVRYTDLFVCKAICMQGLCCL